MKKLLFVLPLVVILFASVFAMASAGADFEDPKLCVAGQWLVVDASDTSATTVTLPQGVAFGDQLAGGCTTPGPDVSQIQVVVERGNRSQMQVKIDGIAATHPVTVSYGDVVQVKDHNDKATLTFLFKLP
jgi:hypothetical protein